MIKLLDSVAGRMATSLLPPVTRLPISTVSSIIIIRPGGIGDAVFLAPVIHSLKAVYPLVRISILAERRNADVFLFVSGVDEVLRYDRLCEFIRALRGSYDIVIDTEQWHRLSAVVARLISAPVNIGFDTNERRRMFTDQIFYSQDIYEPVSFMSLLMPLGIKACPVSVPFLSIPMAASSKASELLGVQYDNQLYVTIFPGASIPERRWGAERFRRVAELLAAFGIGVIVVGGKEDQRQGEVITGGGVGLNLAGRTSLAETAAVIQKSSLLLSGDSGVLHIAVGLGVPTVSLFGPGRAEKWAPRGERHLVINKNLSCSPCTTFGTTPPCPENVACMRDITVDEVFNAVTMLLTGTGAMASRCCKRDWLETA